ncbi:maleylpyruvate isomerase family mycothiol-dependent enzyme [Streptomyces sp. NPDC051940]|uniref:maleylpyruvate isomerase family mycothiol-dependent enzyme n=1 Tax=Streptomyces sp. NPDC051940 TaxID=3155675 RepID=UPI0034279A20
MTPQVRDVLDEILAGQDRLGELVEGLTDEAVREPSALPGWSRAHVLSHLEGIGRALARQARHAVRGELVEVYDGGRPARDAGIEAGAVRSAAELRDAVRVALAEAHAAWTAVGPDDWSRPVRYRDGELRGALLCWWRELEIHTADALLGRGPGDWSRALCGHILDFLTPRAPEGGLALRVTDGPESRVYGDGDPAAAVDGRLADLAAWFAGRTPRQPVTAVNGPLPELGPWP